MNGLGFRILGFRFMVTLTRGYLGVAGLFGSLIPEYRYFSKWRPLVYQPKT